MDSLIQFLNSNKNASESVEPNSSRWMAGFKWVIQMCTTNSGCNPYHSLTSFQCNGEEETNAVNGLIQGIKSQEFNDKIQEQYKEHLEKCGEKDEEEFRDNLIVYTASVFVLLMLLKRADRGGCAEQAKVA